MRLHRPYGYDNACGIIALAIITGWKQETIRKKVLAARRRFPLDEKGQRCKKSVMERSTDYVYQNEFLWSHSFMVKIVRIFTIFYFNGFFICIAHKLLYKECSIKI